MTEEIPASLPLRVADLPARKPRRFDLRPEGTDLALIARIVGAEAISKLSFTGEVRPAGRHDFVLEATLGATAVQPCVVTLAPVTTRIDQQVTRRFLADMPEPSAEEMEIPEDDTIEPLPEVIDPAAVMLEALALSLPDYPRAEGAGLGEAAFAAAGVVPMDDSGRKPFAGLAALRDRLGNGGADDDDDDGGGESGGGAAG